MSRGVSTAKVLLGALVGLLGLPYLSGDPSQAAAKRSPNRPNILLIVTDDQRSGGGSMEVMAKTRKLIGEPGVTFTRAFATLPQCCPSRATMMTGLYAHNHGVRNNFEADELDQSTTLQAALQGAGYHTAIFGKFLNKFEESPTFFDRWFVIQSEGVAYFSPPINDDGELHEVPGYSTDVVRDAAADHLEVLEDRDRKPWFMMVTPIAPHSPYKPAPRHLGDPIPRWDIPPSVFEKNRSDKPPYVREQDATLPEAKEIRRKQLRTQLAVDGLVAKLDRRLRRLDERENTLVIFVSDNGYAWGEHGLIGSHFSKNSPYTESVRVPMLMRWPKGLESGKSKRLTTNVDIAPTIYDATGVEPATEPDGRSLLDKSWQRNTIFLEHFLSPRNGPQVPAWGSVRGHDYQYVETYDENGVLSFTEYYDLGEDHFQRRNLLMDDDPTNDPNIVAEHLLVDRFSTCRGTDGDNPCP